jgi:hypothetical protein
MTEGFVLLGLLVGILIAVGLAVACLDGSDPDMDFD